MPIIRSAIKKMRQAEVKKGRNRLVKLALKSVLDAYKKHPTASSYSELSSKIDKAAKKHIIHKNKAARLKSRLVKHLTGKAPSAPARKKTVKKVAKK